MPRPRTGSAFQVARQPGVQLRAVTPHLRYPVARRRRRDPGLDPPAPPVDESLVAEQVAARMVLRMGRRHALQLLPADLVPAFVVFVMPLGATAMTWTVDDPSDGIQCTGAQFASIQNAVNAANPLGGDIIVVCDGLYAEQVIIDRSLTIQAAASPQGDQAIVTVPPPPLTMTDPKAIIRVTGSPLLLVPVNV